MDRFHTTELERALAEQCFGIAASHIDEDRSASSGSSAFAVITLLEQREIQVKLSNNGYEVCGNWVG